MKSLPEMVDQLNAALGEPDSGEPIQMEFTTLAIATQSKGERPTIHKGLVAREGSRGDRTMAEVQMQVEIDALTQMHHNALAEIGAIPLHFMGLWAKTQEHAVEFAKVLEALSDKNVAQFMVDDRNFQIFPENFELEWISRATQEACDALKDVRFRAAKEARDARKKARSLPSSSPRAAPCSPN